MGWRGVCAAEQLTTVTMHRLGFGVVMVQQMGCTQTDRASQNAASSGFNNSLGSAHAARVLVLGSVHVA